VQESEASRRTTLALRRIRALLASHVLDVKFAALKRAVKANFNPNEPRIPAGNGRESGRWTRIGGPGGGGPGGFPLDDNTDDPLPRVRLAQMRRRGRASDAEGTLGQ
jgi:hypothetical protein